MAPSRGEEEEEEMAVGDVGDDDFSSLSSAVGGEASVSSSEGSSSLWKEDVLLVVKLWFAGFRDACCLHRAYFFCRRSRRVLKKTWQCFLLNGCIFLGSIVILQQVVIPILQWILGAPSQGPAGPSHQGFSGHLQNFIIAVCYVCWLYPLYIISFVLNCLWYNEIAVHAFGTLDQKGSGSDGEPKSPGKAKVSKAPRSKSSSALDSVMLGISEQIYSVIMLSAFFVEVSAVSLIPYVGQVLKFILMSWLYAYYCFDYKWGLRRWSLEKRLFFFETNWAFFAGFGSPCVLATFAFSPLVGGGVMAVVFPLFVLVATGSKPEEAVSACVGGNKESGLPRLQIFYLANKLTVPFVRLFQPKTSSNSRRKTQ